MNFHTGWTVHMSPAVLLLAMPLWQIAVALACSFGLFLFGCLMWQVWTQGVKNKRSGASPEQFHRSTEKLLDEQLQKSTEEWRVPPELDLPLPRPVRTGPLTPRLLRTLPFVFLLALIALLTWQTKLRFWPTAIFAAVGAVIAFSKGRSEKRLLQWGTPTRAVITHSNQSVLHLEYQDEAGNRVRSAISRGSRSVQNPVLTILYDPQNPRESIAYPAARYEIATP